MRPLDDYAVAGVQYAGPVLRDTSCQSPRNKAAKPARYTFIEPATNSFQNTPRESREIATLVIDFLADRSIFYHTTILQAS